MDDFSDEGGSPNGRNKRVQANRLSAQRSRQRKLQKEADLMLEVEELDREIQDCEARKEHFDRVENGEPPLPWMHHRPVLLASFLYASLR